MGIKLLVLAGGLGIVFLLLLTLTLLFPRGVLTTAAEQSDEYRRLQELQEERDELRDLPAAGTESAPGQTVEETHILDAELTAEQQPAALSRTQEQTAEALQQIEGEQFIKLNLGIWYEEEYYRELAAGLKATEHIRVEDALFLDTAVTVAAYAGELEGRSIEVTGFLFEKTTGGETVTLLGWISVTCCILDTEVYGFILDPAGLPEHTFQTVQRAGQIADVPDDRLWVTAAGTIQGRDPHGAPVLKVDSLFPADPPQTPFTYPRYYPEDAHLRPGDIELIQ